MFGRSDFTGMHAASPSAVPSTTKALPALEAIADRIRLGMRASINEVSQ